MGTPGWLILPSGHFEFGRVYYDRERGYTLGPDRPGRLGPETVMGAELNTATGLTVRFGNCEAFVPIGHLHLTWRIA